ncbi:MAG: tRNA (N6-isopentenyl adenosine(37)-C2)-methylthiotransferase MiaB [Mycoplasmataceae bacterium]|nr:tRNA (N6-isopentenyl adenosine(37)-C2)-methylthiotransferase MiaB [Mycoplasmataceae bacterium]
MANDLPDFNKARKRKNSSSIIRKIFDLDDSIKTLGLNKYFYIRTYGCQGNIRDSEIIKGILLKMGYKETKEMEKCDILILNTCAVRENAEKKVFGEIGFLKKLTKKKDFIFGICGCMPQEESTVKKIIQNTPYINIVFGTHNIYELPYIIQEYLNTKKQVIKVYSIEGNVIEDLPSFRESSIKAFVNITYGCDKFCSYCIVPFTRGKLRSRDKDDILNEIKELVNKGYQEVTLLGQNVNSYGNDKEDGYKFVDLLKDVCETKIKRIFFTTSNPWNFDKKIIELYKKYDNLMPFFHLPIQSGSESVLERMNRKMKIEDYINLIKYIRKNVNDCVISTDIIVGFCNESDEEFNQTLALYKKIKYDNAYTFIFSRKEGTVAYSMPDSISFEAKDKRLATLNSIVRKYSKFNNEKYLNKTLDVLVEGKSKTNSEMWTGYSSQWKVVNFSGKCKVGEIVKVKITSCQRFSLTGEKVN